MSGGKHFRLERDGEVVALTGVRQQRRAVGITKPGTSTLVDRLERVAGFVGAVAA